MTERDQQGDPDDPDVRESVVAFRQAGVAVSDGLRTLYEWSQAWAGRRHTVIQFALATTVWFGGNWTYNRVAPFIIGGVMASIRLVSSSVVAPPMFRILQTRPVLVTVHLVLIFIVVLIVQNQGHTRKLNTMEAKLAIVTNSAAKRTDGGSREGPPNGPRAPGGAVIGAIVGSWFGPGGVLAGIYLGFWIGVKLDYRAQENNELAQKVNTEMRVER